MTTAHELEAIARGKQCAFCGEEPRVAWIEGEARLRCGCYPKPPALATRPNIVQERMGQLVVQQGSSALATAQGALRLAQEVKQYLAPKATETEVAVFLRFCQGLGLNPFIKEVYLVKYDERSPAAIVVGIQAYLKWAARNPSWGGFESGIVVMREGKASESQGSLVLPGETLVGGWCVVHRKGATDLKRVVGLAEYNKGQSLWKTMPATMIEKVAIGQAVRRAFPEDFLAFQGLAERMAVTVDEQVGEEGTPRKLVGKPPEKWSPSQDEQARLGFGQDGDKVMEPTQESRAAAWLAEPQAPDAQEGPWDEAGDGFPPQEDARPVPVSLPPFPGRGEREAADTYFLRAAKARYGLDRDAALKAIGTWSGWLNKFVKPGVPIKAIQEEALQAAWKELDAGR